MTESESDDKNTTATDARVEASTVTMTRYDVRAMAKPPPSEEATVPVDLSELAAKENRRRLGNEASHLWKAALCRKARGGLGRERPDEVDDRVVVIGVRAGRVRSDGLAPFETTGHPGLGRLKPHEGWGYSVAIRLAKYASRPGFSV